MAEIAGLVLGAIPLLISALEHYEDVVEPAVAFLHWRGQLSTMTRRLQMGHTAYDQNMRLLLKYAANDQDIEYMIEDPQSPLWKEPSLVDELQSRLGRAYAPSITTIQEIADIMIYIAAYLNIDGSSTVTYQGLGAIILANPPISQTALHGQRRFYFKERVMFTMKRRAMKGKLKQLEECNDRLYNFLEKASKIQENRQPVETSSRSCIQFIAPLRKIQDNASRLHRALHQSWCTGHGASHQAGLLLEQRLRRSGRNRRGIAQPVGKADCFGVSLWRVSVLTWLDTEFSLDEYSMKESSCSSEIKDICSAIHTADHPHVGFCLDSSDTLRGLYEVKSQPCRLSRSCITLNDLLPELKVRDIPLPDFYYLAITLASSVLQLCETPWLYQPWNKESIIFLRLQDRDERSIDVRHPYLTSRDDPEPPTMKKARLDRLNLLALAIMLLEVSTGIPVEKQRRPEDLGSDGTPNVGTDLSTANRWLETQVDRGQLTSAFAGAITCCLQSYVDPTASFDDPEFLKSVEKRVLDPLEREMQLIVYGR
ncbi:hypothetical protein FDECE_8477 [Fusarium decemcellulare]|nr:hypothetical protein FDECE_8477 [Fusarium decemcellulare]